MIGSCCTNKLQQSLPTLYQKQPGLGPGISGSCRLPGVLSGVHITPYASPVSGVRMEHTPYATCDTLQRTR
jgi:hypothetical protein